MTNHLRTDDQTGQSFIGFEQQSRVDATLTRTTLEQHALGDMFADLGAVDYIGLSLQRDIPTSGNANPAVHAFVTFYDAALDSTGGLLELKTFEFAATGSTFMNAQYSSAFVSALWLDPQPVVSVPEPGAGALMACGLAAVAAMRARRRGATGENA